MTGETIDISEYLDFSLYDPVWYKDNAGTTPMEPGRWLGVADRTGRLMCYQVLTQAGTVVARSTVQRVTNLELSTSSVKDTFRIFDEKVGKRFNTSERGYIGNKPDPVDWADMIDNDPDFAEAFQRIYNDDDIPEADDHTPEVLDDIYLNMELALPCDNKGPEYACVTKRLRDANGLPIGTANDNPILDTRLYEVEYLDGDKALLTANAIAENMFSQVDEEGHKIALLDEIVDHRVDGSEVQDDDAFIKTPNGGRRRQQTTKEWEILIQWKDGSATWEALKDVKNSYPVQLAEYALQRGITNKAAFAWWLPYVLKKRNRIIAKIKSKYWMRTHKFGIRIPKSAKEAKELDAANGDHLWWDAIVQEMKNVRIAFEVYEGNVSDLVGYQEIGCHLIFDVKMGENFRRKARLVAGGHKTSTPTSLT